MERLRPVRNRFGHFKRLTSLERIGSGKAASWSELSGLFELLFDGWGNRPSRSVSAVIREMSDRLWNQSFTGLLQPQEYCQTESLQL
jgi:hypothetical protein